MSKIPSNVKNERQRNTHTQTGAQIEIVLKLYCIGDRMRWKRKCENKFDAHVNNLLSVYKSAYNGYDGNDGVKDSKRGKKPTSKSHFLSTCTILNACSMDEKVKSSKNLPFKRNEEKKTKLRTKDITIHVLSVSSLHYNQNNMLIPRKFRNFFFKALQSFHVIRNKIIKMSQPFNCNDMHIYISNESEPFGYQFDSNQNQHNTL